MDNALDEARNRSMSGSQVSLVPNSETSDVTESGLDPLTNKRKREKTGRKPTRDKEKIGKRVEDLLREVPPDPSELWDVPVNHLGAACIEWAEDIDTIRIKSKTMQGSLSKQLRIRVDALKQAFRIFTEKIEDKGDAEQLRRENAKLKAEITANKIQIRNMREEMDSLQQVVAELQSSMRPKYTKDTATSPIMDRTGNRNTPSPTVLVKTPMKDLRHAKGAKDLNVEDRTQFPVLRPPIRGVRAHIPDRVELETTDGGEKQDKISKQIKALVMARRKLKK